MDACAGNPVAGDDCEQERKRKEVWHLRRVIHFLYQPFGWPEVFRYGKSEHRGLCFFFQILQPCTRIRWPSV